MRSCLTFICMLFVVERGLGFAIAERGFIYKCTSFIFIYFPSFRAFCLLLQARLIGLLLRTATVTPINTATATVSAITTTTTFADKNAVISLLRC